MVILYYFFLFQRVSSFFLDISCRHVFQSFKSLKSCFHIAFRLIKSQMCYIVSPIISSLSAFYHRFYPIKPAHQKRRKALFHGGFSTFCLTFNVHSTCVAKP